MLFLDLFMAICMCERTDEGKNPSATENKAEKFLFSDEKSSFVFMCSWRGAKASRTEANAQQKKGEMESSAS